MYRMIPQTQVDAFRDYVSSGRSLPSPSTGGALVYDERGAFDVKLTPERRRAMKAFDEETLAGKPDTERGIDDVDRDPRHEPLREWLRSKGMSETECDEACRALFEGFADAMDQDMPEPPHIGAGARVGGGINPIKPATDSLGRIRTLWREALIANAGYTHRLATDTARQVSDIDNQMARTASDFAARWPDVARIRIVG